MNQRKICVVTGTRAEYGLLYWLMMEIQKDIDLELQVVVTGMHLSPEFGLTYKKVEEDGFKINEKLDMLISGDTPAAIAKSIGLGTISFADALTRLQPDIIVLLGDRFESLAAAQSAMIHRIPIAHIHGGELTEGLVDDPIRHSITKMSHIHFTAAEQYRKRVIQMGEQPDRVFNVGAPGIDGIKKTQLLSKEQLSNVLNFPLNRFLLITLHPTTLEKQTSAEHVEILLAALDKCQEYQLVFTKTNADTDGRIINERIEKYVEVNIKRAKLFDSLGQICYLSALKHCEAVIGNSSSGIIEAPIFYKPTVNIGDRQRGRLKADSIIDCEFRMNDILEAINKASSPKFNKEIKKMKLPYGAGESAKKMFYLLKTIDLNQILKKKFYDIEGS